MPQYAKSGQPPSYFPAAAIHDAVRITKMRDAARISAEILDYACGLVQPGITTEEIDRLVHEKCVNQHKAYPSTLN